MERVFAKYGNFKNVAERLLEDETIIFRKLLSDGNVHVFDAENIDKDDYADDDKGDHDDRDNYIDYADNEDDDDDDDDGDEDNDDDGDFYHDDDCDGYLRPLEPYHLEDRLLSGVERSLL